MTENSSIIVNFPVQTHIYKYLQVKVGEKLEVTRSNFYGSLVLDILSKREYDLVSENRPMCFPVEISLRYMERAGIYIDTKVVRKFNTRIDTVFREEMRTYVGLNFKMNNIPKETSLKQFLFNYNLNEDDIKFETLLKDLMRKLKKD